jgi:hypothetical protein
MNKKFKVMMAAAVICAGTCVFAREPGHHKKHDRNDGLALAAGIVNLVCKVINPQPVIVTPPPPPPVVEYQIVTPPPPPPRVVIEQRPIVIKHKVTPPPPPHRNHNRRGHHR